jgi:hypothetical protein
VDDPVCLPPAPGRTGEAAQTRRRITSTQPRCRSPPRSRTLREQHGPTKGAPFVPQQERRSGAPCYRSLRRTQLSGAGKQTAPPRPEHHRFSARWRLLLTRFGPLAARPAARDGGLALDREWNRLIDQLGGAAPLRSQRERNQRLRPRRLAAGKERSVANEAGTLSIIGADIAALASAREALATGASSGNRVVAAQALLLP